MKTTEKTLLLFAMPGSGKTTWAKRENYGYAIQDRPVIDFDYKGPRRFEKEVTVAQSQLLNAWARAGVKAITTFPQFIDFDSLDSELFQILFILPMGADMLKDLGNRVVKRKNPKSDGVFESDYVANMKKYFNQWFALYLNIRREERFEVSLWFIDKKCQYVSDAFDQYLQSWECGILQEDEGYIKPEFFLRRRAALLTVENDNTPLLSTDWDHHFYHSSIGLCNFVKPSKLIKDNPISNTDHIHLCCNEETGEFFLKYHYIHDYSSKRKAGAVRQVWSIIRPILLGQSDDQGRYITLQQIKDRWNSKAGRGATTIYLVIDIKGTNRSWVSIPPKS